MLLLTVLYNLTIFNWRILQREKYKIIADWKLKEMEHSMIRV